MTGFVVNIDLSSYFEDLRKYASVFVDSSHCKTVGDVERHIKSVFKLDDNICLTSRVYAEDFLIPRSEDVNILKQQVKVFKVQKCDFYDHQIHKGNQVKIPCDQTALNLIHTYRTIDLSCRPKQRLKLNTNHTNCTHDSPLHIGSNGIIKSNQDVFNSSEVCTKEKQKHGKRKADIEHGINGQSDILDMSCNKNKTKYYDNCFSNRSLDVVHDLDISVNNDEDTHECHKRGKKKKYCSKGKEDVVDLASSCWNTWVPDEENQIEQLNKKSKKKIHHNKTETVTDDFLVNFNSLLEFQDITPLKKKRKKETKPIESAYDNCEDEFKTSLSEDVLSNHKSRKKSKKNVECNEEIMTSVEEIQDEYVNCSSTLEDSKKDTLEPAINKQEDEHIKLPALSSPLVFEQKSTISSHNYEQDTNMEDEWSNNYSESSGTNTKRKRVRKHNKKKKKEKIQYSTSVGTLINMLSQSKDEPSPQSVVAKHVFFTGDDSEEQMMNDCTESMALDNIALQGEPSKFGKEICSHNGISDDHEEDVSTNKLAWAEELLKLSTNSSKPVIFHRVPPSSLRIEHKFQSAPNIQSEQNVKKNHSEDQIQNLSSSNSHVLMENQNNNKCTDELNKTKCSDIDSVSKVSPTETKCTPEELQPFAVDTDNIIITNYPIIEKVVVNDLILFKILKMNDAEPGLSKTILAKVKDTTDFPDEISLQIIGGRDECDHLPKSSDFNGAKETEFILDFRWSDIFEPRLFYP